MRNARRLTFLFPGLALVALLSGCDQGGDASKATPGAGGPTQTTDAGPASKYALPADPAGAVSVIDARKAAPKPSVVVFGRVREITKGLAAFTLVDTTLPYCEDACDTPWDYCCETDKLPSRTISVQVKEKGDVASLPTIPELRNLDLVAVVGTLVKDKEDVTLEATGWYRRERPKLPASTKFPQ